MRMDTVLIGVDFSEAALSAAHWTTRVLAPDAAATLLFVVDLPHPPGFLKRLLPVPVELGKTLEEGARQRLARLQEELAPARTSVRIGTGTPDEVLDQAADEIGADLVVIGQHGHGNPVGSVLGTTAEKFVRRSHVPVLVARNLPDGPPRTILLPVDESGHAALVLAWGRLLQERFDAELIVLYTVEPHLSGRVRLVSTLPRADALENQLLAAADAWLEEQIVTAGLSAQHTRRVVRLGYPAHEIPAVQSAYYADLVVMGTRGAGAASALLLGSVAARVLRSAGCSVLLVTRPDDESGRAES